MTKPEEVLQKISELELTTEDFQYFIFIQTYDGSVLQFPEGILFSHNEWIVLCTEHQGYILFEEDELKHCIQAERTKIEDL